MNGTVPFRMFPAVAVEGTSTTLPAGVTVDSIVVRRASLLLTAELSAVKLPFTSEAFADVPAVKGVSGATGPAWLTRPPRHGTISTAIHRIFRFAFMTCLAFRAPAR